MTRRPSIRRTITRRNLLSLTGLAAAGVVATACGGSAGTPTTTTNATAAAQPTAAPPPPPTGVQPTSVAQQTRAVGTAARKEAPQLAQLVRDGKLPPVDQRLPRNPVVVQPVERIGKYGGTWRMGLLGGADTSLLLRTIGYEYLVRWDPEWEQVIPNLAESFTATPDAKTFTFTLREGLKWSDGAPFTADDILFYVDDVHKNKELTPNRGSNPFDAAKSDQQTVTITFAQPYGLFLQLLATPNVGAPWTQYPAHYLKQFHAKYNTTTLEQLIKENGADGWVKLFQTKGSSIPGTPYNAVWQNKDLPTLHAWMLVTPYSGGTRVVAERNPYYWKIDPEGHQLPYIDRVSYDVAQEPEVLVLKAANGEIDMQDRHIGIRANRAVFTDNRQKGGYGFFETVPAGINDVAIMLNLTHKDPVKRQIFQNKDFRIGLSHAIDRQEIIDVVYVGQGEPYQLGPRPTSEFYNERLARQYTRYDVKKAAEYLDRAFPQKDGQGFRLGPDGKRISFTVEVASAYKDQIDVLQLVRKHWQAVGVEMLVKDEDRSLFDTRRTANEHDGVVWEAGDGGLDVVLSPAYYFPDRSRSDYAQAWASYYTNPSGTGARTPPEEPPPATKQQMDLYRQISATIDTAKQAELMRQILDIAAEQFYCLGITLMANGYGVIKNNFKNVPQSMPGAFIWPNPAPVNPPQFYFE